MKTSINRPTKSNFSIKISELLRLPKIIFCIFLTIFSMNAVAASTYLKAVIATQPGIEGRREYKQAEEQIKHAMHELKVSENLDLGIDIRHHYLTLSQFNKASDKPDNMTDEKYLYDVDFKDSRLYTTNEIVRNLRKSPQYKSAFQDALVLVLVGEGVGGRDGDANSPRCDALFPGGITDGVLSNELKDNCRGLLGNDYKVSNQREYREYVNQHGFAWMKIGDRSPFVATHELGHLLGLNHGNSSDEKGYIVDYGRGYELEKRWFQTKFHCSIMHYCGNGDSSRNIRLNEYSNESENRIGVPKGESSSDSSRALSQTTLKWQAEWR